MSLIKKLNYMEVEVLQIVQKLLRSFNKDLIRDGKLVLDQDIIILGENEGSEVVIDLVEESEKVVVIKIEFLVPAPVLEDGDYKLAQKFLLQIDKTAQKAQATLYQDYLDSGDFDELPNDYQDYRLYEELNLLLESAILNYLGKEDREEKEESVLEVEPAQYTPF